MKKTIAALAIAAASVLGLASCGSASRMDELKDFVEKVQKEGSAYTEEQWQEANEEFSELLEKLGKYEDLTPEELKEMAKYQAEFATAAFKQHAGEFMEEAGKAMEEAGKAVDKAGAVLDGTLEGLFEDEKKEDR